MRSRYTLIKLLNKKLFRNKIKYITCGLHYEYRNAIMQLQNSSS